MSFACWRQMSLDDSSANLGFQGPSARDLARAMVAGQPGITLEYEKEMRTKGPRSNGEYGPNKGNKREATMWAGLGYGDLG